MYSCHLFLLSSASVRSISCLSFIVLLFAWNILIFLKRSLVFPIRLFSSISLHWSLRKAFLSLPAILWTLHSNAYNWGSNQIFLPQRCFYQPSREYSSSLVAILPYYPNFFSVLSFYFHQNASSFGFGSSNSVSLPASLHLKTESRRYKLLIIWIECLIQLNV